LVSNPWREAIEERQQRQRFYVNFVSNPWREAIEELIDNATGAYGEGFQSLEGGY